MRLQSGRMVVDFYPTKSWINDNINPDKFLKILTLKGETQRKEIVSEKKMNEEIDLYLLHKYTVISNNTLPQYVS